MNKIIEAIIQSLGENNFPGYRIFVLNTDSDKKFAKELINELRRCGFLCWDSENCILPGKLHKIEQEKAIYEADIVLAIMSKATTSTEGRYAALLKIAADAQLEKSDDGIKLISLLINQVELPYEYRPYRPLDLTDITNANKVRQSLDYEKNRRKEKGIKQSKTEAIWL